MSADPPRERAVLFVDGSNWYNALRRAGVSAPGTLCYASISKKLVGAREWIATRYYVGQAPNEQSGRWPRLYADQRSFLQRMCRDDSRIKVCLGRVEKRPAESSAGEALSRFLSQQKARLDADVYRELFAIAQTAQADVYVEKAVDVMLALDVVTLAYANSYDTAYILSCDGDLTPAVQTVRSVGKKVFAASCDSGYQIGKAVNTFIPLQASWFNDCYRPDPAPRRSR
jgi:uncharacterized LabA/DUF88 family protein